MALMRKEDPQAANPANQGQTHTLLGPESSFEGRLCFQGTVRIDGKFSGQIITEDTLVIGEGAEVDADVHVGNLVLNGILRGTVRATKEIALHMPGKMYGDLYTPNLVIHPGVIFEGGCRMENLNALDEKNDSELIPAENEETETVVESELAYRE